MSIEDFKKEIENAPVPEMEVIQSDTPSKEIELSKVTPPKIVQIQKSLVLNYNSDVSGCGHIRSLFPMNYLNALFAKSGKLLTIPSMEMVFQENLLIKARSLYFQRHMNPMQLKIIQDYKKYQEKYKYKMIWDMDDMIWGKNENQGGSIDTGIPSYNFGSKGIDATIKQTSIDIMNNMDLVSVSTQFLKDYLENEIKIVPPVSVMQNSVAMFFWGNEKKVPIKEKKSKPRVLYTGSPTHYSNEKRMLGDWDNNWLKWVKESVLHKKIEFIVMGGLPWFLEDIKDKIEIVPWVNSYNYHLSVKGAKADIGIMPLIPNDFNRAKSNLKFLEYAAAGIVAIGTTFNDGTLSPYYDIPVKLNNDVTVDEINITVQNILEPDKYNKILDEQYKYLIKNNHWLESKGYVDRLLKIITGIPV